MKTNILFIQGAGKGAFTEDKKLADNLQQLLGNSFKVVYPAMEDEENVPYEIWVGQIKNAIDQMAEPIILVGHSVGASVIIKFLTEEKTTKSIKAVFLIAAPFWGGEEGWTYDGYEKLMLRNDKKITLPYKLFLVHGSKDEVVPSEHLALYAKKFPEATMLTLAGEDHQLGNDLSEIAKEIKKIISAN